MSTAEAMEILIKFENFDSQAGNDLKAMSMALSVALHLSRIS